jgi:ribonuclease VapC
MRRLVIRDGVRIAPFEHALAELASAAWDQYGRGGGHRAQLNFGDCMSYAVAKFHDVPLLYKGGDFAHTDIRAALLP